MSHPSAVPVHMRRVGFDLDPGLAELRQQAPLCRIALPNGVKVWLVTTHDLIRDVLGDPETFGSNGAGWSDPANGGQMPPARPTGSLELHGDITVYDPPAHARLRRILAPAFGVGRMKMLRPLVARVIDDCLDGMARASAPVDFVQQFALPVPSLVICELLGVPYVQRAEFQRRSRDRFDNTLPPSVRAAAVQESRQFMEQLVADARIAPRDGMIGDLVREFGGEITDAELVGAADILLLGGYETTAHMLGLGTLLLLGAPTLWQTLNDTTNIDGIVEELLRYLSVVQTGTPRVAHRDVVLAGQQLRAGERLLCSLPSGNRDLAALGEGLDSFDPARGNRAHLAFGFGIHYCLGASLARMEMRLAFPALARRYPSLRLAAPVREEHFRHHSAVFGLDTLLVEW
ncbi:cytochrome P450 [Lentzea sp. NPDC006480]|uniref:cytochrome P450 n=1 Tax=Lentzea sp. NPDC006480 TaxID=3157176 RepID=UPI0033AE915B